MEKKSRRVVAHPRTLSRMLDDYLSANNITRNLYKYERVLVWLIVASKAGHKVTMFDAEIIGDHVLRSTVPTITKVYGVTVQREWTKRPGRFGEIDCCQYWVDPNQIEKAERLFSKRGASA